MKSLANLINKYAAAISMLILLIIWQGAGYLNLLPKYIIPTPIEIVQSFIKNYKQLIFHSKITLNFDPYEKSVSITWYYNSLDSSFNYG